MYGLKITFMSQLGGDQPGENYCCLYVSSICVSQFLLCVLYVSVSVCIVFVFCLVGTAATIKYLKLIYSFVLCPSASIQPRIWGQPESAKANSDAFESSSYKQPPV